MRLKILSFFALLFALVVSQSLAQEKKANVDDAKERSKLVGVWKGYAVEGKGENPNRGPLHLQITITATAIKAVNLGDGNKDMGEGSFSLDFAGPLKGLDAMGIVLPRKKTQNYRGIYDIEGDTLRWCVDNTNKGRPEQFRTGGGNYLMVLKRAN